jgi:hypothetical protein
LAVTLASLDWVARRYVADPAGVLPPAGGPAGVERWGVGEPVGWVLLLAEGEVVPAAFAAAVESAERGDAHAYRVAVECEAFGGVVRLRGHPVRLLRTGRRAIRVFPGGELGFVTTGKVPVLGAAVVARRLPSLPAEAVDALNAEATALAALAAADGVRPRFGRLVSSGLAGGAGVLFGKGRGRLGWGRWIAAVLAGYRGLLAEAKLWERSQLGVRPPT